MVLSRVGRIVGDNREFFIVFILLFTKSNEVQAKLRYVRLLLYMGKWQSGQMHLTVNQASSGYGGSNPSLPTKIEYFWDAGVGYGQQAIC